MNILEKIEKLILLAGDAEVENARTAAHQACELIRKHGIKLSDPDAATSIIRSSQHVEVQQHQPVRRRRQPSRQSAHSGPKRVENAPQEPWNTSHEPVNRAALKRQMGLIMREEDVQTWLREHTADASQIARDGPKIMLSTDCGVCDFCHLTYGVADIIFWRRRINSPGSECVHARCLLEWEPEDAGSSRITWEY